MARQLGVALVLAGLLAVGLWFGLVRDSGPRTPRPVADDPVATEPDDRESPPEFSEEVSPPEVVESAGHTLDLGEGSAGLTGTITDPSGRPAVAAEVFLYRSNLPMDVEDEGGLSLFRLVGRTGGISGAMRRLATSNRFPFRAEIRRGLDQLAAVRTDELGQYEFTGIASGSYLVAAHSVGTLVTPSPTVEHLAEATSRIDLTLVEAGTLTGSVVGDDGNSIADAKVRILGEVVPVEGGFAAMYIAREDLLLYLLNPVTQVGRTDENGTFEFTGLPFLDYRIFVNAAPWATAEKEHPVPPPAPIEIVLEVGGTIEGFVRDPDGRPVEGVGVLLDVEGGNSNLSLRIPVETKTDADGAFTFRGLAPENFRVTVEGPGWQRTRLGGLTVESGATREVEVTLEPGSVLSGIVTDPAGEPIPEVEVAAIPYSTGTRRNRPRGNVTTDARGEFTIDTVPAGEYVLEGTLDGWLDGEVDATADGPPAVITLSPGPLVSGRVLDTELKPVPRARLEISQGWNSPISHECDADGKFSFRVSEEDAFTLIVRCLGFAELAVEVPAGGGELGDLILSESVRLAGIVYDPEGVPLSGVRVTASRNDPARSQRWSSRSRSTSSFTGTDGAFSLEADDPFATYTVRTSYPLLLSSDEVELTLAGESVLDLVLSLRWGASVFGMVSGPNGEGIDGATVELRSTQNRRSGRRGNGRASGTGEYQVGGLVAGNYQVRVSAPRYALTVIPEISLGEDQALRLDLRLGPERRLTGVVTDERGNPIDRARISVSEKDATRRSGTSDPTGAFSIDRLGRGELTVTVEAEGFLRYRASEIFAADGPLPVVLDQAYTIEGLVLDQGTGEPIVRARVTLSREGERSNQRSRRNWARTDRDGVFQIKDLDVGEYGLQFTAEGYVPFSVSEVRVPARPSEEEIVVSLRAGGRVRGTVYDSGGRGLHRARIRAYRIADEPDDNGSNRRRRPDEQTRSDEEGAFTLVGLVEGRYEVVFSHTEHLEAMKEVTVSIDLAEPVITASLERGAELEGRVYGPGGSLVEGGNVFLRGTLSRRARVRNGGTYRFSGLPAGAYTLQYREGRNDPGPEGIVEVTLPAAGSRTIDLHSP